MDENFFNRFCLGLRSALKQDENAQNTNPRVWVDSYRLPVLIMFPTTVTYFVLVEALMRAAGGENTEAFADNAYPLLGGGLFNTLPVLTFIGTFLWLKALLQFGGHCIQEKKWVWRNACWLLAGLASNFFVVAFVLDHLSSAR